MDKQKNTEVNKSKYGILWGSADEDFKIHELANKFFSEILEEKPLNNSTHAEELNSE